VSTVITHNNAGEIRYLITAKAKRIYIAIKSIPRHNAVRADFFIYSPILGHIIDCSRILSTDAITLPSTSAFLNKSVTFWTSASSVSAN
jgi:hypothetical protein